MSKKQAEIKPYNVEMFYNAKKPTGVFIGTPTLGLVRAEWCSARYGQVIPCNWGYLSTMAFVPACSPTGYTVPDAQNIIVKRFLDTKCTHLLFIEDDNVVPPDLFLRVNAYVLKNDYPIVSGLYFTKTSPAEPLIYRGRANSFYTDWRLGDRVEVNGVPTGTLLIHRSIMEALWEESPEYVAGNVQTRRVFSMPEAVWFDPNVGWLSSTGTSDLEWCARIMKDGIFEKAGWPKFQKKQYPFLVDTNIFVYHIDHSGRLYPSEEEKACWLPGRGGYSEYAFVDNSYTAKLNGKKTRSKGRHREVGKA